VAYAIGGQSGALHEQSGEVEYVWGKLVRNPALIGEWDGNSAIIQLISTDFYRLLTERIRGFERSIDV